MSVSAHEQFVNLIADAIEQHMSQDMTWLDFWRLLGDNVTHAEIRLAEALSNFGSTQLDHLDFGGNHLYWREPTVKAYLMDYMKKQTSLRNKLGLEFAFLSSDQTLEFMQLFCEMSSLETIQHLKFNNSANFESDDSCSLLAKFIDTASSLKKLEIHNQLGDRKV